MASIVTAASHLAQVLMAYKNNDYKTLKDLQTDLNRRNILIQQDGSITRLLGNYIIEPTIICTDRVRNSDIIDYVTKMNTDLFFVFYSQAFQILTAMNRYDATIAIDLLSTNKNSIVQTSIGKAVDYFSKEDYFGDFYQDLYNPNSNFLNISMEGKTKAQRLKALFNRKAHGGGGNNQNTSQNPNNTQNPNNNNRSGWNNNNPKGSKPGPNSSIVDPKGNNVKNIKNPRSGDYFNNTDPVAVARNRAYSFAQTSIKDDIGLDSKITISSIIRTFEITIGSRNLAVVGKPSDNGNSFVLPPIKIPVTIKAYIINSKVDQIINMIEPKDRKKSFFYRLDEWKSGAIKFKDLVLCSDLIKQYKANRLKDTDGLLKLISERDHSSTAKSIKYDGINGFEKYYNMIILTTEEKAMLDKVIGGDIFKYNYKEKFLTQARSVLCTVLDDDYERATIMIKDLKGNSTMSYKALKGKKDSDFKFLDILKSLSNNTPPF